YYNYIIAEKDVNNLEKLLESSRERVAEIRKRANIGRSRKSELVEAEAQLHTVEAQVKQSQIQLEQIAKNFEFFTKLKPSDLKIHSELPKVDGNLSVYLSKIKSKPDILAAEQRVKAATSSVEIAK